MLVGSKSVSSVIKVFVAALVVETIISSISKFNSYSISSKRISGNFNVRSINSESNSRLWPPFGA